MHNRFSARFIATVLCMVVLSCGCFASEGQVSLSTQLSPSVSMSIEDKGSNYLFGFSAENPYAKVSGRLAIGGKDVKIHTIDKFPASVAIKKSEAVENRVLLGLEVSWYNADGSLRQREVFGSSQVAGLLPERSELFNAFDIQAYFEQLAREKLRIFIPTELKAASKVTVVLSDANGRRVRNLVSGISYPAGQQKIEWDGRTDYETIVAPGTYNYKVMTHPGLSHDLLMQFSNGGEPKEKMLTIYGPNHSQIQNLCSNEKYIFAAAPNTEGGNAIIAMTFDGKFAKAYTKHHGTGLSRAFPVADESHLYVFNDGVSWGGSREKTSIQVSCYEIETSNVVQLASAIKVEGRNIRYNTLCDSSMPEVDGVRKNALQGAALLGTTIYFSHLGNNQIMMYDTTSNTVVDTIPAESPGRLAVWNGQLYAVSGKNIVQVDTKTKQLRKLFSVDYDPVGLAVGDSAFYVLGHPDSTIKVYDMKGKGLRGLGDPGGYYTGKWQQERLVNPFGIAFAKDKTLWVAELRWNPKRLTQWNPKTGKILYEKNGPPTYGSPSAGFDAKDSSRWIADGCLWDIDTATRSARVVSVLLPEKGHLNEFGTARNYRFVYHNNRTFVIGQAQVTTISELLPDNTLKDLAAFSSPNIFSFAAQRREMPAFSEALTKMYPDIELKKSIYNQSAFMMWVDKNGNGGLDADEFQFTPYDMSATTGYWGFSPHDLSFQVCARDKNGEIAILDFKGDKFNDCGAPEYNLEAALASAKPVKEPLIPGVELPPRDNSYSDHLGNVILNESPYMYSFNKSGALNWFFPNRWNNVHGSQKAPLPIPGQIQGQLFPLGIAPLDKGRDVMALMNNHGRVFFMTSDGLYIDELFSDVRVSYTVDENYIGGEHFGGVFDCDAEKKQYLLQAGNSGYRIYRIAGLDKLSELTGTITVTQEQLDAAAKLNPIGGDDEGIKELTVTYRSGFKVKDLDKEKDVAEWQGTQNPITLRSCYDNDNLYISFRVSDPSPWVNNGKDITTLFKTGDCVDLQLATDSSSSAQDPKRRKGANGDVRLLIAPFNGGNAAILYRHVVENKSGPLSPMEFNSPWRGYKVDDVKILESVKIEVNKGGNQYTAYATIPLSDLGLTVGNIKTKNLRGDFGVIFGDSAGTVNLARLYWSNKATGLVNDVPGEMMPEPSSWGTLTFGGEE